ncbi:DUF1853 family protein [Vreelandella lutescens]|uniref:DUF1853 family protein n=1 Tax=Vreelandella lutescens TaxID=1602943 RepID=A0ABQ1PDD3_9GAMM|nr:DUF1853 family protein [Halomonas lutescens]GGC94938.1 hypothetical protein GCM10011382_26690 [Halomonas lutescens]
MTTSAEGVSDGIHNAVLRDIAWLLETPDLVSLGHYPGRPPPSTLGLAERPWAWINTLLPQVEALNGKLATRMGHYHERLWQLLLDNAPNTRLLANNLRIHQRRITLGELDMLYRTRKNPAPVHLEVAIKFYLGLPEGPGEATSQSRWIGPGGLDSLALKCSHLLHHQLPLSRTPGALANITHWLAPRDVGETAALSDHLTQQLAMPGVLFYPWQANLPPPAGATAEHRRGWWCHQHAWPRVAERYSSALQVAWLAKPHWLAPPTLDAFGRADEQMADVMEQVNRYGPQQVMLYDPKGEESCREESCQERPLTRLMVVPNDWPRQVPLPPKRRG